MKNESPGPAATGTEARISIARIDCIPGTEHVVKQVIDKAHLRKRRSGVYLVTRKGGGEWWSVVESSTPMITIRPGNLQVVTATTIGVLITLDIIYRRASNLVRRHPSRPGMPQRLGPVHLRAILAEQIRWRAFDIYRRKYRLIGPPREVVVGILTNVHSCGFRSWGKRNEIQSLDGRGQE